jgi:hypothetical protein
MIFTPTEINYNTLRQHTQQYVLILQDPRSIQNTIKFTVRPPRIRTHLKGDGAWNPWWRTALLIQSPDTLPLPTLQASCGEATSYLRDALQQALHTSAAFLSSIRELQTAHTQATYNLRAAPDGAYILSRAKKDSPTQLTDFVISIEDPVAYGMLATHNDPIKTSLNTTTTSKGQTRQQITPVNITAHMRSVLGRTYWQLLTNPNITQLNATTTPLRCNQTKRLKCRPSEKIAWATTLMAHPDILTTYEGGLQELKQKKQRPHHEQQPPNNITKQPAPPSKDKGKTPPTARQVPDPLKQLRQKQAAEAEAT